MKIKNIIIGGLAALMLFGTACEDDVLVKLNPNEPGVDEFYKTPEEAELAVNSVYSALQFFGVFNRYWGYAQGGRSDESVFTEYVVGLPEVQGLDDFTMTSSVVAVHEIWRDNYKGILKANMVLEQIQEISFSDEAQKNRILGESYFLRALYHFILIKNFGEEIPMYDKVPATGDDFYPASAVAGDIYKLIEADFAKAKSMLPNVEVYRGTDFIGKISKGAATSFLGTAFLWQEKYQEAADEFAEVINGECGHYELITNFRENHNDVNENNLESIFEVQYELTAGDVWNISGENQDASEAQIIEQGQTMVRDAGSMWWNMAPSDVIQGEFEISDPRYYKTFWCPGGDTYEQAGADLTYEQYSGASAPYLGWRKWCRDYATADNESDVNIRVMRLADVYLMYAECVIAGASGAAGSAEQSINAVRNRARNIPGSENYPLTGELPTVEELIAAAPVINGRTINNLEAALRHERMVELAGEGKRWDDIVRWGIGTEVCGQFYKPWLPIYQGDLDTNPSLKPNSSN
ncbi:MAG: RagB/SusD family nutrient uptake outer membrane protein [Salinivirgaceae bacterium]|jgi:hypothetical protein|nr:RagB/SusD family nutrient uptake outer membrane protein [Salinivirgaceae bacterium]